MGLGIGPSFRGHLGFPDENEKMKEYSGKQSFQGVNDSPLSPQSHKLKQINLS
jgi:hypothetical protein